MMMSENERQTVHRAKVVACVNRRKSSLSVRDWRKKKALFERERTGERVERRERERDESRERKRGKERREKGKGERRERKRG